MTFIVSQRCGGCKHTECVVVCPVDCFYEGTNQLFINPKECIDCTACMHVCPEGAIYSAEDVPFDYRLDIIENEVQSANCPNITEKKLGGAPVKKKVKKKIFKRAYSAIIQEDEDEDF